MSFVNLRHAATFAGVLALADCSSPFAPGDPAITVSFDVQPAIGTAFVLRSDIDGRRVELAADPARGGHASVDMRGGRYGSVPVRVTLLTAGGDSVTGMSFSQDFQHGYQHWVAARVGGQRPVGICLGTVLAVPVTTGSSDTLYVMYGGIPEGAVC